MPALHRGQKRYTCQVSLALAAQLEALFEMHPEADPNQLMADLLALGLAQIERTQSERPPAALERMPDTHQPIYLLTGPFDAFHGLVHKHHLALERAQEHNDIPPATTQDYRLNPDE